MRCPGTSPGTKFHLVMRICATGIEDDYLASVDVVPHIVNPQVAVHKTWSDTPPS